MLVFKERDFYCSRNDVVVWLSCMVLCGKDGGSRVRRMLYIFDSFAFELGFLLGCINV